MNKSNMRIKGEEADRLRFKSLDFIYQERQASGIIEPMDENLNDGSFIPVFKCSSPLFPISSERVTNQWVYVPLNREELDKLQKSPKTNKLQLCIDSPLFEWSQTN